MAEPRVTWRIIACCTGVALAGLAAVALLMRPSPARQPACGRPAEHGRGQPPPCTDGDTPRSQLTLHEGQLCLPAGERFTGYTCERYEGGQVKARLAVSNGVLEGVAAEWYANGQQQVAERFRAGVSDGQRTRWYENGQRQSEALIVTGRIEGVFRRWHENGVLAEAITMQGGKAEGEGRAYYPSGALKAEVDLRGDRVVKQRFWKDGERPAAAPGKR